MVTQTFKFVLTKALGHMTSTWDGITAYSFVLTMHSNI